jgi:DNA-binding XRE family transcriptional regulator
MKTEIIKRNGKPFVVVPLKDYEHLLHNAEMFDDIRAYDAAKAKKEESFPAAVAERLAAGEHPIRVFRNYRELTQQALAKKIKIARPYLAEIESGRKQGSVDVLKSIAKALKIELDDIT